MFENIARKNKKWIIISYISIILFIFLIFFIYINIQKFYPNIIFSENNAKKIVLTCPDCVRRNIDGVYVKKEESNYIPIAIMIDNHIDARPSFGLSKANLVYESEAEGGITRYLAIYATNENIEKIGPVRSARPYYVDWAQEFSALYAHCGGSPEALVQIAKNNILDLNEFYKTSYFWREKSVKAPHNIYTSLEKLKNYEKYKNRKEAKYFSWIFKDDKLPKSNSLNNQININFRNSLYEVKWKYDIINNNYIRYLNKEIHRDHDNSEIRAKNIILQYVESRIVDDKLRLEISTIGEGKALICLDGECKDGKWIKKNKSTRVRFYNEENNEFEFNAGNIWIEIIRDTNDVMYN